MGNIPESTMNLLVSGLMGLIGSLVSIPIHLLLTSQLKREEQLYQHKLDMIAKQRELVLQHKLEMERKGKNEQIAQIQEAISKLEKEINRKDNTNG